MSAPEWLDRAEYPFTSRHAQLEAGAMHYVDEGSGAPIVMVHGTPDWSFVYRNVIKALSPDFRCIAPDSLGFGLSDKPAGYPYTPARQAHNLKTCIEALDLRDITLMLHDFGGPFGLAYAIDRPQNVRALVLMNTWMWSLRGDPHYERAGRLVAGALGRLLYLRLNFSARVLMKHAMGDRSKLPQRIHRHYTEALGSPRDRAATWAYARSVLGASEWYDTLWRRRDRIRDIPTLILWGMKDVAFREKELRRLETVFSRARTVRFERAGHFVQEEDPAGVALLVREFLAARAGGSSTIR